MKPSFHLRAVPDYTRDDVLAQLVARNRQQIAAIVSRSVGGSRLLDALIDGEASSAFMLAASRALDNAHAQDDGRGKNDPLAWASWRGLNAVRDLLRTEIGEKRSPMKQQFRAGLVYSSDLEGSEMGEQTPANFRPFEQQLAELSSTFHAESAEDTTIAHLGILELLTQLDEPARIAAELMLYGRSGGLEMTCACRSRHTVARDLEATLGVSREDAQALVKRVQVCAAQVFGLVA